MGVMRKTRKTVRLILLTNNVIICQFPIDGRFSVFPLFVIGVSILVLIFNSCCVCCVVREVYIVKCV